MPTEETQEKENPRPDISMFEGMAEARCESKVLCQFFIWELLCCSDLGNEVADFTAQDIGLLRKLLGRSQHIVGRSAGFAGRG